MYWMKVCSTLCVFCTLMKDVSHWFAAVVAVAQEPQPLCFPQPDQRSREKSMDQKRPDRWTSIPMGSCPTRAIIILC